MKLEKSKCVYVFYNPLIKISKIGYAQDVNTRKSTIQSSSGMEIKFIYSTVPIYNYIEIEKIIHNKFNSKRGIGEWFHEDPEKIVNYIKAITNKFMIDEIFKKWKIESNISALSKEFGVSRTAIKKHLEKYNLDLLKCFDVPKIERIISGIEAIDKKIEDVPFKSKKVKPNIYEYNGLFYVKKFIHSKWFVKELKSIGECEEFILSLNNPN